MTNNLKVASVNRVASTWLDRQAESEENLNTCPVCEGPVESRCRCMIGDKLCQNGHEWVVCPMHEVRVIVPPGVNTHDGRLTMRGCWCALGKQATKSDAEREDEEVERLSRPSPSKKPPRDDSKRERMDLEKEDNRDPDLSMNYKDVGG